MSKSQATAPVREVAPAAPGAPVKLAYLQSGVTIPGKMASETTLNATKQPGLKMYEVANGLLIVLPTVSALVPAANVKILVYE